MYPTNIYMIIDNYMCTTASMTAISNLPIEPESLLVQRMHPNVFYKRTQFISITVV